jgi:hypothetical protein
MKQAANTKVQSCNNSSTSPRTSHKSTHIVSNGAKEVPRVGDIGILYFARSPNHFTKFFILGIKVLFQLGDEIFKVKPQGLASRLVCWKLWQNVELQQTWQLHSSNEQTF